MSTDTHSIKGNIFMQVASTTYTGIPEDDFKALQKPGLSFRFLQTRNNAPNRTRRNNFHSAAFTQTERFKSFVCDILETIIMKLV